MHFKRQSKVLFSLESVAITDIIMNMFIFFFITFSFLATFHKSNEGELDVNLPKAASATPPAEKKGLSVNLTQEGGLFLGKELIQGRIAIEVKVESIKVIGHRWKLVAGKQTGVIRVVGKRVRKLGDVIPARHGS